MAQFFILADKKVSHRIPEVVKSQSLELSSDSPTLLIDASEENKSLATIERIWEFLFANGATRNDTLVNIGGGVVCDLGGFAASTYKRGMSFIQVPTTLLSMVDAAHGGKSGFNYRGVKNSIGLIRQPKEVHIYKEWLETLPEEELLSGYGEIIKCALLENEETFYGVLAALEDREYSRYIDMAIGVKRRIVEADPDEKGLRKVLNLGHTVGHAIEAAWQNGRGSERSSTGQKGSGVRHGYCVVWGLVAAMYLSVVKLGLDKKYLSALSHTMIEYYGRPKCNCKDYELLLQLMQQDKKNIRAGEVAFTLVQKIGNPVINEVALEREIKESLDYLFSL